MAKKAVAELSGKTIDEAEVKKFSRMADEWWDERGKFKPLHKFNPVRVAYIKDKICQHFGPSPEARQPLKGMKILDVGCGGGLLAEPLTKIGAVVTGIDASEANIKVASQHAGRERLEIDYQNVTIESLAKKKKKYDAVLAMEVLEHVADVKAFMDACVTVVKPGGLIFVATMNRTAKSFVKAIVGAEYLLRWLPVGTHSWNKFLRPSEIERHLRRNDAVVKEIQGVTYRLTRDSWILTPDIGVNYVMVAEKKKD